MPLPPVQYRLPEPPKTDETIPPPLVACRPVEAGQKVGGARAVINLAAKHGWKVRATYARGPLLDATGTRVARIADSVRLVLTSGSTLIHAYWIEKSAPIKLRESDEKVVDNSVAVPYTVEPSKRLAAGGQICENFDPGFEFTHAWAIVDGVAQLEPLSSADLRSYLISHNQSERLNS